MKGYYHSIETLGSVDGPGLRFVLFMQGCIMRCAYCHNPDSWEINQNKSLSSDDVVQEVLKYKNYYGGNGQITLSGGEPLLQLAFVIELFTKCQAQGIHTCLDTSGICFKEDELEKYKALVGVTDLMMLDIKQIDLSKHQKLTGKSNENILKFLAFLNENQQKIWIRYVLVPTLTNDETDLKELKKLLDNYAYIERIEVLPYHKMGIVKYAALGLDYPLKDLKEPTKEEIENAISILGGEHYE